MFLTVVFFHLKLITGLINEPLYHKENNNNKVSIADELRELAQLKKEGIITEEEFADMKEDLIE